MFASSLAKGFYDRGEQRNRQRGDIAKAFNEFKQANPEATAADFQSFIDATVGNGLGSNYLRGGAPSKQVLNNIATDNLRNKNRRIQEETRKDIMAQGDLSGYLSGQMDKFLLDADPDKLDDAKNEFLAGLSPEARAAVDSSGTLNQWTEKRYNFLQGQRTMSQLPQIENFLKMNNYDLNSVTPESMAAAFGISVKAATGFVNAAKVSVSRYEDEWWQQNNGRVAAAAEKAASLQGANKGSITQAVNDFLKKTSLSETAIQNYGGLIDGLATDAEERAKTKELGLENEAAGRMANFEADVEANQDLARLIANGDRPAALKKLMTIAKRRLNDTDFEKLFGTAEKNVTPIAFSDILEGRVEFLTDVQQQQYQQNYSTVEESSRQLVSGFNQTNITNMEAALKSGLGEDMAGQLAYALGSEFYATSDLAAKIFAADREMPENIDRNNQAAVVNYLREAIAPTAIPIGSALAAQKGMMEERSGLFKPQAFPEFIKSESVQLTTAMSDMDSSYFEILDSNRENPENIIIGMNQLLQNIGQFQNSLGREMEARERNRLDWIKPNTGGYNPAQIKSEIIDKSDAKVKALSKLIEQQIKSAEEAIKVRDALPPANNEPTVDDPSAVNSPVMEGIINWSNSVDVAEDISNATNYENVGGIVGTAIAPLMRLGVEGYERTMLSEEENVRRDDLRAWLRQNKDRLYEFAGVMKRTQPETYQILINDLGAMTAEAIERKYGETLDILASERTVPTQ